MKRDIITIGASGGGVEALAQIVSTLPQSYQGTVFVALHLSPNYPSRLSELLSGAGCLPATHPSDGERIRRGRIYVAPPDRHILLERDVVRLYHGPKENQVRPSIDPLFRSAAEAYSERVIGVLLSGMLYDGTAGLIN
ncbi:MAG: chemotaxis protein CheB, partial [Chloroflexi bacterium]|nr:chemotaxis protein CheB [Chloroflexota bacterium]